MTVWNQDWGKNPVPLFVSTVYNLHVECVHNSGIGGDDGHGLGPNLCSMIFTNLPGGLWSFRTSEGFLHLIDCKTLQEEVSESWGWSDLIEDLGIEDRLELLQILESLR